MLAHARYSPHAPIIRRIELLHGALVGIAKQCPGEACDACGLAGSWRASNDDIGHVAFLRDHLEPVYNVRVAHDVVQLNEAHSTGTTTEQQPATATARHSHKLDVSGPRSLQNMSANTRPHTYQVGSILLNPWLLQRTA